MNLKTLKSKLEEYFIESDLTDHIGHTFKVSLSEDDYSLVITFIESIRYTIDNYNII